MVPGWPARVRSQIWQRVTGNGVRVTGMRRQPDMLTTFHDASPAGVTLPRARRTRDSRQIRSFTGPAVAHKYSDLQDFRMSAP